MSNERNSLKAGIFILASIVLIIAVIVAIKGVGRFLEPMQHAAVSFKLSDDIGGLAPGDEVRVGGAKVGVVRDVAFADGPDGSPIIAINFTVPRRFTLHKDAVVGIQSTVTGVSVLNFSSLGSGAALAQGEYLAGRPSALSELFNAGPDIVAAVRDVRNTTLPKVNTAIDRATDTIGTYKETGQTATEFIKYLRTKIDPIIERYYALADTGKGALQHIGELFGDTKADFRTTMANVRDATGTVKEKLPGIMDKMDGLLVKITTAVDDTTQALQDVKKIASNTRDATHTARSVIVSNRGKIDAMIASLKETGDNLKNASAEVRRSPWRLLYKPGPGEMANLNLYDSARQFADGAGELNDAAMALRDALKDPDANPEHVQKLVDKLDKSFSNFNQIEQELWKQVQQ